MKRMACLIAALALLPLFALAETPVYENAYPFTLYYDESLLEPVSGDVWYAPNALRPREGGSAAALTWEWAPEEAPREGESLAPAADFDLARDWTYAAWEAGSVDTERLTVYGTDEAWAFTLTYPAGDPDGWGEALRGVLMTLDFPPQAAEAGAFRLDFFQGGAAGMRFLPVEVDAEAAPIVLSPRETVTGFVLERVEWDFEGFTVASAQTLYAAETLETGDHLLISCYFGDVLPTLRACCLNAAGEAECWYLFQSGRDGSLLLLPPADFDAL